MTSYRYMERDPFQSKGAGEYPICGLDFPSLQKSKAVKDTWFPFKKNKHKCLLQHVIVKSARVRAKRRNVKDGNRKRQKKRCSF